MLGTTRAGLEHFQPDHDLTTPPIPTSKAAAATHQLHRDPNIGKHLAYFTGPVDAVYVEYKNAQHEIEYYDITKNPYRARCPRAGEGRRRPRSLFRLLPRRRSQPRLLTASHPIGEDPRDRYLPRRPTGLPSASASTQTRTPGAT